MLHFKKGQAPGSFSLPFFQLEITQPLSLIHPDRYVLVEASAGESYSHLPGVDLLSHRRGNQWLRYLTGQSPGFVVLCT